MPKLELADMCLPGCKLLSPCWYVSTLYTEGKRSNLLAPQSPCSLWWHSSGGTAQFPQDTQVRELWVLTGHLALWPLSEHRCVSAWGSCCPSGFCGTKNELSLHLYFKNQFLGFFFTPVSILSPTTAVVVALPGWEVLVFPMWPLLPLMLSDHYHLHLNMINSLFFWLEPGTTRLVFSLQ